MAAPKSMSGRGILFVNSRISRPDVLSPETYLKWYDEDHIAEIIETSGIKSARRFIDVDPSAERPYLAMYPMDDIAFTQGDEFRKIRVKSDILPPPGVIYDLADVDVRYDNLVHVHDPTKKGKGATKSLLTAAIELGDGVTVEEFDKWYREEHCRLLESYPGYLRTTRFKLVYARTNAESRILKGLAPPSDVAPPTPPTWLTLHEFEVDELDMEKLSKAGSSPWCDKMTSGFSKMEVHIYRLAKEFGEKDWFHGVEI
ncbi:hypothetical protein ACRE_089140 [Hapsidospora chrysogenum ATCC 11550]|uniref:EthD domain-containing protein n=1 Tax=Hapsidospora chrysogenum (strain ATCC 11550 / CBS 779.69 / DSM 880 / IAM 14645 / JCM 23072 / IMI 49137) TaxID=857340 RepID=A0A086STI8_HAPC1|nr:hypothetical protein ACRE_089140 [Hapsidospora chrysogenum ATCC 11550]